jgi:hypothetical protein
MPEEQDLPEEAQQEEPSGISVIPQSENQTLEMEVHHHPDLHHEKKKWKEYFLEFLMIFLAVTLGFIAENIREYISEHERAKVFAASLLRDLKEDTAQLKPYRAYFDYASKNVDTLMQMLSTNDPKDIPSGKLYWFGLWGGAHRYFTANDATFEQMKSSGSLRFFDKTIAYDAENYNRIYRTLQTTESDLSGIYTEARKSRALIFQFRYNDMANNIVQANWKEFNRARIDSFMNSHPPLLNQDKVLFNQYVELVRSRFMHSNVVLADSLLNQSYKLIKELEKKYDLANE